MAADVEAAGTPGHGRSTSGHGQSMLGHGRSTSDHDQRASNHDWCTSGNDRLTSDHNPSTSGHDPSTSGLIAVDVETVCTPEVVADAAPSAAADCTAAAVLSAVEVTTTSDHDWCAGSAGGGVGQGANGSVGVGVPSPRRAMPRHQGGNSTRSPASSRSETPPALSDPEAPSALSGTEAPSALSDTETPSALSDPADAWPAWTDTEAPLALSNAEELARMLHVLGILSHMRVRNQQCMHRAQRFTHPRPDSMRRYVPPFDLARRNISFHWGHFRDCLHILQTENVAAYSRTQALLALTRGAQARALFTRAVVVGRTLSGRRFSR